VGRLKIAGVVQYADLSPVQGAAIEIIDLDQGGNGNDIIMSDVTSVEGKFRKETIDWNDTNNVRVPWGTQSIPDLMVLQFKVRKDGNVHEGPFVHVGDWVSVPILTPWLPNTPAATVNGVACESPDEAIAAIKREIGQGRPITIRVYDPVAAKALEILGRAEDTKSMVVDKLGISTRAIEPVSGTALIILAIAALVVAVGAGVVLGAIGVGLIMAISEGYRTIGVRTRSEVGEGGTKTYTELVLEK
jgi:hypothetical protein